MPSDPRWRDVSDATWSQLAQGWLRELEQERAGEAAEEEQPRGDQPVDNADADEESYGAIVVRMNFTADAYLQWEFIKRVMADADDHALGHIAAGPVEHLLSRHGEDYIDELEALVRADGRWRSMIGRVWRCGMSDQVWKRVQELQSTEA